MKDQFNFDNCHAEWKEILSSAMQVMDKSYLNQLIENQDWLPGLNNLFAAFSVPLSKTKYLLIGESPYPRIESANGFAFWDHAVTDLWSSVGLSKQVNRATSLRNWIKMLLVARGDLTTDTSQHAIAQIDKSDLAQTAEEFFKGMMNKGILLLNATLVYSQGRIPYHARYWKPFMQFLFERIGNEKSQVKLILFGKIAEAIPYGTLSVGLVCEHPYNISFITNENVIKFFQPLDLLANDSY